MRVLPILTALLVAAALYLLVMERDAVMSFAGVPPQEASAPAPPEAAAPASGERRVSVVAMHSRAETVQNAVMIRGRTEAARQVEVRAETSGKVISEPQRKGAFVEKGDPLCKLDAGTREATLMEAKGRLSEAKARLEDASTNENAASRLSESGFASETRLTSARATLQAARAGVQTAEAAVAQAKKEIERLTIAAPFAGVLESDAAEIGTLLQPGALCATVIRLDPLKLVGFVPETEVETVERGAEATARLASGGEVAGQVTFLSRSADPETRTFRVEVEIANPDLEIRDGQTVEITIASGGEAAHLLPQSAMTLNDAGEIGVRVVGPGGNARFRAVSVLRDTREGVWATGLPETADVIVVGQEYVTDGAPVKATYRGASE